MSPVDYRSLLKKYISHVGDMEGVAFIDEWWLATLSPEESAAMNACDAEAQAEWKLTPLGPGKP